MNFWMHIQAWSHLGKAALLKINLPVRYLLDTSFLLVACMIGMLLYMLFYLWQYMVRGKKIRHLKEQARGFISEVVIAENTGELPQILEGHHAIKKILHGRLGRKIFVAELLKIRKCVSGQAVVNIQWLYQTLQLQQDSLKRLTATKWHLKAAAIQELAQMGGKECITRIYRLTNHKNIYVRTEAQLALVNMTGFQGLRFLNVVAQPLTQWQQVCLMQQLSMQADIAPGQVAGWLQSTNDSVIELALKIVGAFKMYALLDKVNICLQHQNQTVRLEAMHTLSELDEEAAGGPLQKENSATFAMHPLKEKA
jgi:hypothetical protein